MSRKTLVAAAWLALAAVAAAPSPAHAQFGSALKRAAKKKIEEKTAEKVVDKAAGDDASAAAPAGDAGAMRGGRSSTPTFDGRTLELTPDVVSRFLKAVAAEGPARAALAKDKQNEGVYRAKIDKYDRCNQRVMEKRQREMEARNDDPKMAEWQLKYVRALMSGDTVTVRQITDSLVTLGIKPDSTCGKRPVEAYEGIDRIENSEREVEGVAADAGDFSTEQYAVMKERVIPFVVAKRQGKSLRGGFSKTELDALEAKSAELQAALKAEIDGNK